MPTPNPRSLSVCMIVKNESAILGRCLNSVKRAADEIVVVDTGSSDNTAEIARSFGAKVISTDWQHDFSLARNISLENASGEWILWLDADDVVPEESVSLLIDLKKQPADRVFAFLVRNEKGNNIGSEFMQARMFPRHPRIRFERRIHEQIMPSALRIGLRLENKHLVIEHHGYANPGELAKKARRNAEMLIRDYKMELPDPVTAVEIADSYNIIEEYADAAAWYERVLEIPQCEKAFPVIASQAHMGLGNIYNKRENPSQAIIHFQKAVQLCENRPDALYGLAVAFDLDGRKQEAINTLNNIISQKQKRAVQVSIDFRQAQIKAILRLAIILGDLRRFDELGKLLRDALEDHGNRPEIHNMAGTALYQQGRLMDALHEFEKSLHIAANGNIDAFGGLCIIYSRVGRFDVLEKTLATMHQLFQDTPRYWALCALLADSIDVPSTVDMSAVENEIKYLSTMYGIADKRRS